MRTTLRTRTGAPGESIYPTNEIASFYDSFGLLPEFVEKVSLKRKPSPAEEPGVHTIEGRTCIQQFALNALEDSDDIDEDDDDIDEVDLDEDISLEDDTEIEEIEVTDEDLTEDLDLDEDDDEEDDDII